PLAGADLEFRPRDDLRLGSFGGQTGPDGKFTIRVNGRSGMPVRTGRYVALITKNKGVGLPVGSEEDREKALMRLTAPGAKPGTLPALYASPEHSPFTVEIKEGNNGLAPFELSSRPKKP